MKRLLLMSTVAVLALSFGAVGAMAEKVSPAGEPIQSLEVKEFDPGAMGAAMIPTCQVGNLNAISYAIPGFAYPPEEYALIIDPSTQCSACPTGLSINTIHILVRTTGPCDVDLEVGMREVGSADAACPDRTPGAGVCLSGLYTATLSGAGVWDVALPVDCPCADPNYPYALTINYMGSSCFPEPDLITDALPSDCTSWNDYGAGWTDLVTAFGFPGNLAFFADAVCCEPPVSAGDSSWGAIKGLFRN